VSSDSEGSGGAKAGGGGLDNIFAELSTAPAKRGG
jgi:hypothetical protein